MQTTHQQINSQQPIQQPPNYDQAVNTNSTIPGTTQTRMISTAQPVGYNKVNTTMNNTNTSNVHPPTTYEHNTNSLLNTNNNNMTYQQQQQYPLKGDTISTTTTSYNNGNPNMNDQFEKQKMGTFNVGTQTNEEVKDNYAYQAEPSASLYETITERWIQLSNAVNNTVNYDYLQGLMNKVRGKSESEATVQKANEDFGSQDEFISKKIGEKTIPEEDVALLRTAAAVAPTGDVNGPASQVGAPAPNPVLSRQILTELYDKYCPPDVQAFIRKPGPWTVIRHPGLLVKIVKLYLLVNRPYKSLLWQAIEIARGKTTLSGAPVAATANATNAAAAAPAGATTTTTTTTTKKKGWFH